MSGITDEQRKQVEEWQKAQEKKRKGDRGVREQQKRNQADLGRVPDDGRAKDWDFDPLDLHLP
jgi:hypothetical protein